jgi:carboxylesterase type B
MKRLRLDNKNTVKDILSFFNDTAREMERERKEATTTDTYGWIDTMRLAHHLTVVERVYSFLFDDHTIRIEEGMDRCQKTPSSSIIRKREKKTANLMRFSLI